MGIFVFFSMKMTYPDIIVVSFVLDYQFVLGILGGFLKGEFRYFLYHWEDAYARPPFSDPKKFLCHS